MPFIQRLIEPINLAQSVWSGHLSTIKPNLRQSRCECYKCQNSAYETFAHTHNDNNVILNSSDISQNAATCHDHNIPCSSRNNSTNAINVKINRENAATPLSPMKKLKQHIEFSSSGLPSQRPICTNATTKNDSISASYISPSKNYWPKNNSHSSPCSPSIVDRNNATLEFDSISNITLSNTLRQLASLVLIASDIFDDLQKELRSIGDRAYEIQNKIVTMERRIKLFDPKLVKIPEGDLVIFAQYKIHYKCDKSYNSQLFTVNTRPLNVRVLYEKADSPYSSTISESSQNSCVKYTSDTNTEIANVANISIKDNVTNDDRKISTTIDTEIEIRLPATFDDLRKWTSTEALGDVTVTPDCMHHVNSFLSTSPIMTANIEDHTSYVKPPSFTSHDLNDDLLLPDTINANVPLNHRLPSPEEQCKTIALKYPAEIVPVDVSGKGFQRMCSMRSSVIRPFSFFTNSVPKENNNCQTELQSIKRRSRSLRAKTKRRNTIAGTDQKELRVAANSSRIIDDKNVHHEQSIEKKSKKLGRSKSSDVLKKDGAAFPYDKGKSTLTRLNALKQWGRNRFKLMSRSNNDSDAPSIQVIDNDCSSKIEENQKKVDLGCIPNAIHEEHKNVNEHSNRIKGSLLKSPTKNVITCQNSEIISKQHLTVQLRDTTCLNRLRHNVFLNSCNEDQPHSSSGNWSASSESGRTSIGSEIAPIAKSSASNTSLNAFNSCQSTNGGTPFLIFTRRKFLNTSASNSVTSESTLTPELAIIASGENMSNQLNDDETSSAYSCDTEGYYTSFHMDSGLRTLKEEDVPIITVQSDNIEKSTNFINRLLNHNILENNSELTLVAENDYELFGHGSTSTTTSSAGTVCTTLRFKSNNNIDKQNTIRTNVGLNSGLELTELVQSTQIDNTNTINNRNDTSLINSNKATLDNLKVNSINSVACNEIEYSGSSDLESLESTERIKQKTIIRSKHIPSMCIITPITSDDENEREQNNNNNIHYKKSNYLKNKYLDSAEESNQKETTYSSCKKTEQNEDDMQKYKTIRKLNKQKKLNPNECANFINLESLNTKSLNNISFVQKTQPPLSAAPLTENNSAHVHTLDISNNNKKAHLRQKCYENENESIQSQLMLNSESKHLNGEEFHINVNIANKNTHKNLTNSILNKSILQSSYNNNNNEMYKNLSTLPNLDKGRLIIHSNNESTFQQQQKQQQEEEEEENFVKDGDNNGKNDTSLVKDIIYSTPIKSKGNFKTNGSTFNRASPIYWTLQTKKYLKAEPLTSTRLTCRDDSYASHHTYEENSGIESSISSYSPLVKSKCDAYLNSTLKSKDIHDSQDNTIDFRSERLNTCADRTGKAKTSLMDFKKLLLAKSVQTSVLPKKMSAVELLKKNPNTLNGHSSTDVNNIKHTSSQINKNLKLLHLNGSPKRFANRRMLRQGQFGSPSQSLTSKSCSSNIWNNNSRTDIISTIIPEVHGEIEQNQSALDKNFSIKANLEYTNSDDISNKIHGSNSNNDNTANIMQTTTKQVAIPTLETAL